MRALLSKNSIVGACAFAVLLSAAACGGSDDSSRVSVRLYSWSEDAGFATGITQYPDAQQVRVRVTKPGERLILSEEGFSVASGKAHLPEVAQGEDLRLEFEVRDSLGIIATGATPIFSMDDSGRSRAFRAMVSPVNSFAPVGSVVRSAETGEERLVASRLDGRELDTSTTLGRVGHTANITESGEILIVGGGQIGVVHQPGTKPNLMKTFADIQLFDPATGYFTELAGDDAARRAGAVGMDRLREHRAFHTVTPLGQDRFLVVGGYTVLGGGNVLPSRSIEVIDLNAAPGQRIQSIYNDEGAMVRLNQGRGMHTATRRTSDGAVIIAGGMDDGSVLSTIEIVYPGPQNARVQGGLGMQSPRVGHSAVLMDDGSSVWIIGGRTNDAVLASTEIVAPAETGTASTPAGNLTQPRYGAAVTTVREGQQSYVLVAGGFTGTTGGASADYELGRQSQRDFVREPSWSLTIPRGEAQIHELPQSRDLLIIGGYGAGWEIIPQVERLEFQGTTQLSPFTVDARMGSMYQRRVGFAGVGLNSGRYLLVGGFGQGQGVLDDAEYLNAHDPVIPRRQ